MKSELFQLHEQGSKVQIAEFWIYCCGIRRSLRSVTERNGVYGYLALRRWQYRRL